MKYTEAPSFLKGFLTYKKVICNRSDLTVNEYALDLTNFFKFTFSREDGVEEEKFDIYGVSLERVKTVKSEQIYEYMLHVSLDKQNGAAARARKLVSIREFFKYLYREKIISVNPAADISTPAVKNALPKFLTLEESVRLLECVKSDETNPNRYRDYAIFTLFLNCGMRLSELVGINLDSINWEDASLRIRGKGNKERTVYLNGACIDALKNYIAHRPIDCRDPKAMFVSRNKRRISAKTVQWTVKKYLTLAGLGGRDFSTHKLRHTAATLMYRTGNVDVRVLKDILGHEQLNTTQIYTHVSDMQMKKAIEANPLANINEKEDLK